MTERGYRSLCWINTSVFVRRGGDHEAVLLEPDDCAIGDPRGSEDVFRETQPAAATDHDRVLSTAVHEPLVANPPVADVDDAVRVLGGHGVVADDERGRSMLADELGDEREHLTSARSVELAGRLVGDEETGPVREGGAESDALLLAAGELARVGLGAAAQADAIEKLECAGLARVPPQARKPELDADELCGGQLAGESAPVVLIRVAEELGAVPGGVAWRERGDIDPGDSDGARRGSLEPGDDADEGGLAGAARPEDDTDLPFPDDEGQTLERSDSAFWGRVDAEEVADVDECAHSIASTRPGAPSAGNARRVAAATSTAATSA